MDFITFPCHLPQYSRLRKPDVVVQVVFPFFCSQFSSFNERNGRENLDCFSFFLLLCVGEGWVFWWMKTLGGSPLFFHVARKAECFCHCELFFATFREVEEVRVPALHIQRNGVQSPLCHNARMTRFWKTSAVLDFVCSEDGVILVLDFLFISIWLLSVIHLVYVLYYWTNV